MYFPVERVSQGQMPGKLPGNMARWCKICPKHFASYWVDLSRTQDPRPRWSPRSICGAWPLSCGSTAWLKATSLPAKKNSKRVRLMMLNDANLNDLMMLIIESNIIQYSIYIIQLHIYTYLYIFIQFYTYFVYGIIWPRICHVHVAWSEASQVFAGLSQK